MKWMLTVAFVPVVMMILATYVYYRPPRKINFWYGYRTKASMRNQDTWEVANRMAAKLFLRTSLALLALVLLLLMLGKAGIAYGFGSLVTFNLIAVVTSTLSALLPLFVVESRLKKLFDSEGKRK